MSEQVKNPEQFFGFFNEISIIAQLSGHAFEKAMPEGMTMPQFAVLNHLARAGDGTSPLRISRAMQVTKGAMTNTLHHLERKKLVQVRPDQSDGRAKQVFITEAGHEMRGRCIAAIAPHMKKLANDIPVSKLAATLPLLRQVREWLDKARD